MHDPMTAQPTQVNSATSEREPALPLRGDTFLGVCAALGQDTRIPADLFRIAFAGMFFWNMGAAVAAYLGLGTVIALSRWVYPTRRSITATGNGDSFETVAAQQVPLAA